MSGIHDKLGRVRKPRVHITYDVETEGAVVRKELPFVVGVLGDFSGDPAEPLRPLGERKFIQIDRDNFDQVLARMTPGLELNVENCLAHDGSTMPLRLGFEKLEDFEPVSLVQRIEPLRRLLQARDELRDLLSKADRSEELEALLEHLLTHEADLREVSALIEASDEPENAAHRDDATAEASSSAMTGPAGGAADREA